MRRVTTLAAGERSVFGAGLVQLGRGTPQTAALIAEALRALPSHRGQPDSRYAA